MDAAKLLHLEREAATVLQDESVSLFDAVVHFLESSLFPGVALYVHIITPRPVHVFRKIGIDVPELTLAFSSSGFRLFLVAAALILFGAFTTSWLLGRRRVARIMALANLTCGVILATLWLLGILIPLDAAIERLSKMPV